MSSLYPFRSALLVCSFPFGGLITLKSQDRNLVVNFLFRCKGMRKFGEIELTMGIVEFELLLGALAVLNHVVFSFDDPFLYLRDGLTG